MLRSPETDLWRVALLPAPATELLTADTVAALKDQIVWLPDPGPWRYLADPFGLQRNGSHHIFVEAYDYNTKHAVIEHFELRPDHSWRPGGVVLAQPVHLSYPFILEQDGEVFMVPESNQAGEVALYRARSFPHDWVRETALLSDVRAAEPSLIQHDGTWWMFYTVVGPGGRDQRELHLAFADRLTGPWAQHPLNPILIDQAGARPGGTPLVSDGCVILPVQDCSQTYGGALRFLKFTQLTRSHVAFEHLPAILTGDLLSDTHRHGLHTFAACGSSTLVDVKETSSPPGRRLVDLKRRWRKWTR